MPVSSVLDPRISLAPRRLAPRFLLHLHDATCSKIVQTQSVKFIFRLYGAGTQLNDFTGTGSVTVLSGSFMSQLQQKIVQTPLNKFIFCLYGAGTQLNDLFFGTESATVPSGSRLPIRYSTKQY